jgi:glyoxylase-like metal-dependent hydrolase (beta-lactamase superfamily II)
MRESMNIIRVSACIGIVALCLSGTVTAQVPKSVTPDLAGLAAGKGGQAYNRAATAEIDAGRTVLRLDARNGDGGIMLDGALFSEGAIELDLKGKDVAQQSFLGVLFHAADWTTFDAVYFRPFNFRGADAERRSHSVQFVAHPAFPWQRLRTERTGQFENTIDPVPDPNGWFHARVVIAGGRVEVFVNGAAKPSLSVEDIGPHKSGGVGLFVGNGSDGAFANLTITPSATPGPAPVSTQNIFQASATGNLVRVRALVDADPAVLSARNPGGLTALHAAAMYGQRAVAEYLLSKGMDPNVESRHSGRPLDLADNPIQKDFAAWFRTRGGALTPAGINVFPLAPHTQRLAFPWGMMNNIVAFATGDGAVIVDSGFVARTTADLKQAIAPTSPKGVRYVINSHAHGDHVAGNTIAPSPQAVLTSSSLAAQATGGLLARDAVPLAGRSGRTLPAPYTLRAGGMELKLIPRPGLHSDADLIVWAPSESVVAMGDLLLSECVPALDDIGGYFAFLDDVLDVFPANTIFVSGHGRDLDVAGLKKYRDTLAAMVAIVRTQLAAGRTAEQMAQDNVLGAYKPRLSLLDFLPVDAFIPRAVAGLQQGTLK